MFRNGVAALMLAGLTACSHMPASGPEAVLPPRILATDAGVDISGSVGPDDLATYRELAFTVPEGVRSLSITVDHDRKGKGTVIDLGLRDPSGFRGWSGSNKSTIHVSAEETTPSFRAGPVMPGVWTLILGLPAVLSETHYRATITFDPEPPAVAARGEPGWRRGDFHAHTAHSDGSCANPQGLRVPCPVHFTLDAAVKAGLDFVSVTDHNTLAQNNSILELEPFYPALTVVRGSEITTFQGHANALGIRAPVDFQLGSQRLQATGKLHDQIDAQGGLLSISHPGLVSGRLCMGCGWTAETDWSRVAAIEVINGGNLRNNTHEDPQTSGVLFWEKLLNEGHRLTAIGGSDNHDATNLTGPAQSPVGTPATVIWTDGASEADILAGVRSGRAFVDLQNAKGRMLDLTATFEGATAQMGGELKVASGEPADVVAAVEGAGDHRVEFRSGGLTVLQKRVGEGYATAELAPGAKRGWVRADVRDASGKLLMIGNPVWLVAK